MTNVSLPLLGSTSAASARAIPAPNTAIDCIVVGYNDVDFEAFTRRQQAMAQFSGGYVQAKWDSVRVDGRRMTYLELLSHALKKAHGVDPALNTFESPNLAACHLAHYLRQRSYKVEVVNLFNKEKERFAQLLASAPNAVAITTTFYVDPFPISEIVQFIRKRSPRTKIIVGGPFVKNLSSEQDLTTQNYILQSVGADIYIIGTHELHSLGDVAASLRDPLRLPLDSVPNLILTSNNKSFLRTGIKADDYDMAENRIDWRLLKESAFSLPVYMRTAVSCPFACTFCCYPVMAGDHKVEDVSAVEQELAQLHEAGVKYVVFVDDTFNVPLPRFKKLLRMMIDRKFDFRWVSFFRCSNADEEAFDLMRESGCLAVTLGIESGDQTILNNMKKFARTDKYIEGIHELNRRGIVTYASIICGFPGETRETIMNTFRFLEEAAPTFFTLQLYYHNLRAPIHKDAEKFKIRGAGFNWSHATMDWREAAEWMGYIYKNIKRSIPLTDIGCSIWSLPYIMSKGVSLEQFLGFARVAREMLLGSFDDVDVDFSDQLSRMSALFNPGTGLRGS